MAAQINKQSNVHTLAQAMAIAFTNDQREVLKAVGSKKTDYYHGQKIPDGPKVDAAAALCDLGILRRCYKSSTIFCMMAFGKHVLKFV